MRLGRYGKFLHHDRVALGANGYIDRYTVLEVKFLGALVLNVFNTTGPQDRFHTHAFNAISIMLWGSYNEFIKSSNPENEWVMLRTRRRDVVYLPRTLNHCIGKSTPGAVSITLCGPWKRTWTEERDGKVSTLGWGRRRIS